MLFYKFFCQTPLTGVGHPCRSPIVRGCWRTDTEKWWKCLHVDNFAFMSAVGYLFWFCHYVGHLVGHLQVGDRPSVTYEGKIIKKWWKCLHEKKRKWWKCLHVGILPSCRPSAVGLSVCLHWRQFHHAPHLAVRIWMAWNLNCRKFDSGPLIAYAYIYQCVHFYDEKV